MRIGAGLAVGLLFALSLAGCGGNGTNTPATGNSNSKAAGLQYAQCLRENGVPDFPDPEVDDRGRLHFDSPDGVSDSVFQAAHEKCQTFLPSGPAGQSDAELAETMRKFSQCVRQNGIPNFPDPEDDGKLNVDLKKLGLSGEEDPRMKAAEEKCEPLLAGSASGTQQGNG